MSASVLYDVAGPVTRRRYRVYGVVAGVVVVVVAALAVRALAEGGAFQARRWEFLTDPVIMRGLVRDGLLNTVRVAVVAIALALVFGAVFAAGRLSERAVVRWVAVTVTEFFRAVPLLLLILFVFLAFGTVLGRFWSLTIALVLYNGSVLAEIFRAGILAVPRGQSEAAYAVGMRKGQVMRLVLIPQGVRVMLPAIISQSVVALKDTALGLAISAPELVSFGKLIYVGEKNPLQVGIVLAAIFIVINVALSGVAVWLERRLRQGRRSAAPPLAPQAVETGVGQP